MFPRGEAAYAVSTVDFDHIASLWEIDHIGDASPAISASAR